MFDAKYSRIDSTLVLIDGDIAVTTITISSHLISNHLIDIVFFSFLLFKT